MNQSVVPDESFELADTGVPIGGDLDFYNTTEGMPQNVPSSTGPGPGPVPSSRRQLPKLRRSSGVSQPPKLYRKDLRKSINFRALCWLHTESRLLVKSPLNDTVNRAFMPARTYFTLKDSIFCQEQPSLLSPSVARIPIPVPPPGIIAKSALSFRTRIRVHKRILRNARERRQNTTNIPAQPLQKEQIATAERGVLSPQRINPLRESPVITDTTGKVYGQRSCSLRTPGPSANVMLSPVSMELDSTALELVHDSEPPLAMGTSVSYGSSSGQEHLHRRLPHPLPTCFDITSLALANWSTPELLPKEQLQSPVAIDRKPHQKRSRSRAPPVPSTRVLRSMSQAKPDNVFTPAAISTNASTSYEIAPSGVRREPRKPLKAKRATPSTLRVSASAPADDASAIHRYNLRPRKRQLGEDEASKQGGKQASHPTKRRRRM